MRKAKAFIGMIVIGIMAYGAIETSAQKASISNREFSDGIIKAEKLTVHRRLRETEVEEILAGGIVIKKVETIIESDSRDGIKSYEKTTENGRTSVKEEITVGEELFEREDDGDWKRGDYWAIFRYEHVSGLRYFSPSCDQYTTELVNRDGDQRKLFDGFVVDTNGSKLSFYHDSYWIGLDGLPYRIERISGKLSPMEIERRSIKTYEYDPTIKIAAPIK